MTASIASPIIIASAGDEPPSAMSGIGVAVGEGAIPKPTAGPAVGDDWTTETTLTAVGCGAGVEDG